MFCFLQMCPSSWEMSKEVQQSSLLGLRRETNHQKCYWGLLYEVKLLSAWEWVLIRHIWPACPSAVLCTVSANYSCQGRELFLRDVCSSQNHRTPWVGRKPQGLSIPTPVCTEDLPKFKPYLWEHCPNSPKLGDMMKNQGPLLSRL